MQSIDTILTLDLSSATKNLVSTLASVDSAAQSIAPLVGVYRYQITAKEGKLAEIEKKFPTGSLAPSTLRNCKLYEHVFREHVQSGLVTRDAYMALTFADCRALLEARTLAKNAAKAGKLKMTEAEREACKAGLPAKEILASVKKADKAIVTAANKAAKEREAAQEKAAKEREADTAAFKAWKASGSPTAPPPPPPAPDTAGDLARVIMEQINTLAPRQRALMPDLLRGIAEHLENAARESTPANVIPLDKAA